jgi:hypothetical protein
MFWRTLTSVQQQGALDHIKTTADRCQPSKRNAGTDLFESTASHG